MQAEEQNVNLSTHGSVSFYYARQFRNPFTDIYYCLLLLTLLDCLLFSGGADSWMVRELRGTPVLYRVAHFVQLMVCHVLCRASN